MTTNNKVTYQRTTETVTVVLEDQGGEFYNPPPSTKLVIPRYEPWPEGVQKLAELEPLPIEKQLERMGYFRKIVAEWQYQPVRWYDKTGKKRQMTVDGTTASMVCNVIDKLDDTKRAMVLHFEPPRLIDFLWKLVGASK